MTNKTSAWQRVKCFLGFHKWIIRPSKKWHDYRIADCEICGGEGVGFRPYTEEEMK